MLACDAGTEQLLAGVACGSFDLVFLIRATTFALLAPILLRRPKQVPLVIDFDDVESIAVSRELRLTYRELGVEASLCQAVQVLELARWERSAMRQAAMVGVCSSLDSSHLKRRSRHAEIVTIPNTVPYRERLPEPVADANFRLLMVGALNYDPNEDAALFFVKRVLPELKLLLNGRVRLAIVGRAPRKPILDLQQDEGVLVHADVASVETFYVDSDIVVVPIRHGGGTRIKIIEALAMGRPVVSTRIGAEGLELVDGRHLLLADTPSAFVQACLRLCLDLTLRRQLVLAGRQVYLERYVEQQVRGQLTRDLRRIGRTVT
jgi:polysaccharide biosynthesis protein PslH